MRYSSTADANWPSSEVLGNQSSRTSMAAAFTAPSRSMEKPPSPIAIKSTAPKAQVTFPPIELRRMECTAVRIEKLRKRRIVKVLSPVVAHARRADRRRLAGTRGENAKKRNGSDAEHAPE